VYVVRPFGLSSIDAVLGNFASFDGLFVGDGGPGHDSEAVFGL
jgi:hypothetical protein